MEKLSDTKPPASDGRRRKRRRGRMAEHKLLPPLPLLSPLPLPLLFPLPSSGRRRRPWAKSAFSATPRPSLVWSLFLLLTYAHLIYASPTDNVYITSSYGQLVTSSTLRWQSTDSSQRFYLSPSVLHLIGDHHALCRGYHENQLVPGSTDAQGKCTIGFFDKVYNLDSYQVMVDVSSSSRLEWRKWDIFTKLPYGLVGYTTEDNAFVARYKVDGGNDVDKGNSTYRYGDLNPRRGLSGNIAVYYSDGRKTKYLTEGEILVEVEPIKYELQDLQFHTRRAKTHRSDVALGTRQLRLDLGQGSDLEWKDVRSVIAYNASYHYYWGQLPGLIKALPAVGENFARDKKLEFEWGLPLKYVRHRILDVSARLRPGTTVQVSASAYKTTTEVPYTAKLICLFSDGKTKKLQINSTYLETLLTDVRTVHGWPFFTNNGSYAPTTTQATTVVVSKTTTTRTTTTTTVSTTTLRPKRTTIPLPTRPNPLLRFYPALKDLENADQAKNGTDDKAQQGDDAWTQRNNKLGGNNKRSPVTESLINGSVASPLAPTSHVLLTLCLCVASWAFVFATASHKFTR